MNELSVNDKRDLEVYYGNMFKKYGVSCKVIARNRYAFSQEEDIYLAFGINGVPESLDVKDICVRNERSDVLFYPDYFAVKLDRETAPLSIIEDATYYCKNAKLLKDLYAEHNLPLPSKIRLDELGALKEHNKGRNNRNLNDKVRRQFEKGLKKFFKQEKTKNGFLRKWRDFTRTDKFNKRANFFEMLDDFRKRDSQITSIEMLHKTNDDLKSVIIHEHEFERFKEEIKRIYPDVLYSVSELNVENLGYGKQKGGIENAKEGAFGKIVSYEDFCKEREKRFAKEGYEAIQDLSYAYTETRQLTFKNVDEPFVASVLNSIRFAYAKCDSIDKVKIPGINKFSYLDLPVEDLMNFVSLAKANNIPFHIDFFGRFGEPKLEDLRIVYSPDKDGIMRDLTSRMVSEKIELSHINTSHEEAHKLDQQIEQASLSVDSVGKIDAVVLHER